MNQEIGTVLKQVGEAFGDKEMLETAKNLTQRSLLSSIMKIRSNIVGEEM